jgi:HD-GYP domain-containing protein (c-di-GMP phosphodiesterase class II)
MTSSDLSRGRLAWSVTVVALFAVTVATLVGPLADRRWDQPELMFSLLTVAGAGCMFAATMVIAIADRRDMAEIGLLGTIMMAASVLPLARGLATPGVLYDTSDAFRNASFVTMPIAIAVGIPLLVPGSTFGRWAARRWRSWSLISLLGIFGSAMVVVYLPNVMEAPTAHSGVSIAVASVLALSFVWISRRQMHLYELGRRRANLVAAVSIVLLAVLSLAPLASGTDTVGSWWIHGVGTLGVLGACIGLAVTQRMSPSANGVLAPILTRDPLVAFELGLSPTVHTFVSEIEIKDQITRDHVIRTGELAMRVGERYRMSGSDLRNLGLAAMLHDVGKVHVPDEILKKPARLTAEEYEVMKLHPVDGEAMIAADPALASAARIVRSHHERFDGGGYPDGLAGRDIPLASRIIAVCDAFDAMTNDRQYRKAMSTAMAFAILREHAGSQWDERVVEHVMAAVATLPVADAFDAVGRTSDADFSAMIPSDIRELLVAVDAEI